MISTLEHSWLRLLFAIASLLPLLLGSLADAQERSKIARIGILRVDAPDSPAAAEAIRDFKEGLNDLGYVEGENIVFDIRWAVNKVDQLPGRVAELIQSKPDIIVTGGPQPIRAAKDATSQIPIVMGRMDDVVEHGLVTSLARPGGNVTGLSFQTGELAGKWLDLLKEVMPKLSRAGVLWDTSSTAGQLKTVELSARAMGLPLEVFKVSGASHSTQSLTKREIGASTV